MPRCPKNLEVVGDTTDDTIMDDVHTAFAQSAFVIVDIEGTANLSGGFRTPEE
jgi:chromosome partitioning protein